MAFLRKRASKSIFCFLKNGERHPLVRYPQPPHSMRGRVGGSLGYENNYRIPSSSSLSPT